MLKLQPPWQRPSEPRVKTRELGNGAIELLTRPKCPGCEEVLDGATGINDKGAVPKPNDLSLCVYCGMALRFTSDMELVEFPESELRAEPLARMFIEAARKATLSMRKGPK